MSRVGPANTSSDAPPGGRIDAGTAFADRLYIRGAAYRSKSINDRFTRARCTATITSRRANRLSLYYRDATIRVLALLYSLSRPTISLIHLRLLPISSYVLTPVLQASMG